MPAGDLLTTPGQVEWDGALIDITLSESGYWLPLGTGRNGWSRTFTAADTPTATGAASGAAVPQPMYPTLIGVACETAADLLWLEEAMIATHVPRPLAWWDRERDVKYVADACPRRGEPQTGDDVQLLPHRYIDLMWFIAEPATIEVLE